MILVTTAGKVGAEAARLLREQDTPVRVLVRDPDTSAAQALAAAGAQIAAGDLTVPATIDAAMADVRAVILVSPAVPAQELNVVASAGRVGERRLIPFGGGSNGFIERPAARAFKQHSRARLPAVARIGIVVVAGDEVVEAELLDHLEDGLDVAVRERSGDADGVGGGDEGLALERTFDEFDDVIGQVGEVAEGLVSDGLSLADGPAEQMSDVGLTIVDPLGRGHVYGAGSRWHVPIFGETPVVSSKFLDF